MKCDCNEVQPCVTCVLARLVSRMETELQNVRLENIELKRTVEALRQLIDVKRKK
jgi:hypothetical protein